MTLIYALLVLGLGAGASLFALRQLKVRRRRSRGVEEHAARQRRIDHLAELVASGERDAHFDADVTVRLRRFVESLRAESQL